MADGKSILSLITLLVKSGEEIIVEVIGDNPEAIFALLEKVSANSVTPIIKKI